MPEVSIIMTCYNKPDWLAESMDSVMNQTFQDWELWVMDDNSPQAVWDILWPYDEDPRVHLFNSQIREEDRYATARYATLINRAFNMTRGDYITYLVDDDMYYPDRLQIMMDFAHAHPDYDVMYHSLENIDADSNPGGVRPVKGILDGLTEETQAFNYVDHNMVMHTRQAFIDANGWYDVPGVWGGADAYFWRRLNEAGYVFHPIDDPRPLGAKRYHHKNVQSLIVQGKFFPEGRNPF